MNSSKIKNIATYHLPTLIKIELKKISPSIFGRLSVRPLIASLNITGRCIFRCRMCGVWHNASSDELEAEEWKDIFRQLKTEGVRYLNFTGGEPLLRSDLEELLAHASSLGFYNIIASNGYLLSEELASRLIDKGAGCFCISLDALGEDFDKIRGVNGAYERVSTACQMLSRLTGSRNIKAIIYITLMKSNLGQVMDVVRFAEGLRLPVFFNLLDYTPYFFQSALDERLWIGKSEQTLLDNLVAELVRIKTSKPWLIEQSQASLRYIQRYFQDPLQKNIPCSKALIRICIGPQGTVFGGCWSGEYFGNLRDLALKDIIHSQKYLDSHRKRFLKACPGCSCGYQTDLNYSLESLFEEAGSRILNRLKNLYN